MQQGKKKVERTENVALTCIPCGEGRNRGWDGGMASPTWWTWVWASPGSWGWTGRPGVLRSMGSQSRTRLSDFTHSLTSYADASPGTSVAILWSWNSQLLEALRTQGLRALKLGLLPPRFSERSSDMSHPLPYSPRQSESGPFLNPNMS